MLHVTIGKGVVAHRCEERRNQRGKAVFLLVIVNELAGEDNRLLSLIDGTHQDCVGQYVVALFIEYQVNGQHTRLTGVNLLDDLANLSAVAQFHHIDHNNVIIQFDILTAAHFVIDICHVEILKGLFNRIEHRKINRHQSDD